MQILIISIFLLMVSIPNTWPKSDGVLVCCAFFYPLWVMGFSKLHAVLVRTRRGRAIRLLGMWAKLQIVLGFAALCAMGWVACIRRVPLGGQWHVGDSQLLTVLLAIAPSIVAMIGYWALQYERVVRLRQEFNQVRGSIGLGPLTIWSRRGFLAWQLRSGLLFVLVPLLAIQLGQDGIALVMARWTSPPYVEGIYLGVMVLGVFILSPRILVWIAGARPMGDTPVRRELETLANQLGVRYRSIRVWPSGGAVANAAVMGLLGRLRYILVSDSLLQQFTPPQVRAVFGHELGHVRQHHILYLTLCMVALSLWSTIGAGGLWAGLVALGLSQSMAESMGSIEAAQGVLSLGLMVLLLVAVLGRVSRLFERQADMEGAYCASHPEGISLRNDSLSEQGTQVFAEALERLAWANAIPLDRHEFRHGSLGSRIDYLLAQSHCEHSLTKLAKQVRLTKRLIGLALVAGIAGVALL
jgi:STE24 endopeptidase